MILDGAVRPNADPVEEDIKQAEAFQDASTTTGDSRQERDLPAGTDPAKAVDVYLSMVRRSGRSRRPKAVAACLTAMRSSAPSWPVLAEPVDASDQGLTELKKGRGDTMMAWPTCTCAVIPRGTTPTATDVRAAVTCVEPAAADRPGQGGRGGPPDARGRTVHELRRVHRARSNADVFVLARPPTSKPHSIAGAGPAPTLVVSTTGDPATPYQAGVELAKELKGGLLTYQGTQHTVVFQGNAVSTTTPRSIDQRHAAAPDAKC